MEDKDRRPAPEAESGRAEEPAGGARVYDIDSDAAEPVTDPAGSEAGEPADADGEPEVKAGRRPTLKVSRKDLLDRFSEKNSAIARLAKEKATLEKSFEGERAASAAEKESLETQLKEFKDRWMRTAAEFENYRKRSAREWELLKQQSRTEVILEVLNSLDDFERAFAVVGQDEAGEFVRGIRLIYNNLLQVLQKLGVGEIDALHQPFDPMHHMAIGQIEAAGVESGHVAQVVQKGYVLNGSVIRPAHVIVAK